MIVKLVVLGGKLAGKEILVRTNQFLIGRDETCNLRPNSNVVSKLHCAIVVSDESVWLRDLKSTNGTFHNGVRIEDRVQLSDGDKIKVGPLAFEVRLPDLPKQESVESTETKTEAEAESPPKPAAVESKKRPSVDDEDVFEWLSEADDESSDDSSGEHDLSEQGTMIDMQAMTTETLPDIVEPTPGSTSKTNATPAKEQPADSSSAAANLLKGAFARKRA